MPSGAGGAGADGRGADRRKWVYEAAHPEEIIHSGRDEAGRIVFVADRPGLERIQATSSARCSTSWSANLWGASLTV